MLPDRFLVECFFAYRASEVPVSARIEPAIFAISPTFSLIFPMSSIDKASIARSRILFAGLRLLRGMVMSLLVTRLQASIRKPERHADSDELLFTRRYAAEDILLAARENSLLEVFLR